MTIHVVQGNSCFTARVIFNFRQVVNIIILRFDKPLLNSERDIVLWYSPRCNEWYDLGGFKNTNPELFRQIEYKLRNVINANEKVLKSEEYLEDYSEM